MWFFASCTLSWKNHRNKISFSQHQDTGSKRTKQGSWRQWHRGLATSTLTTQPTSTTSHYPYQNVGASWEVMSSSSNWIPIEFASREKTLKASLYFPKGREGWLTGYEAQRAYTHPYRFLNIDIYKNKGIFRLYIWNKRCIQRKAHSRSTLKKHTRTFLLPRSGASRLSAILLW